MKHLAAAFLILLIPGIHLAHSQTLHVAASDWPPYHMEENGRPSGLASEIILEIFRRLEVTYEINFYPWKRCMKMYESGRADAVYLISRFPFKQEREKHLYYPETPICKVSYVFFIRKKDKEKLRFKSFDDLAGYGIGVTSGYSYSGDFWKGIKGRARVEEADTDEQNFKKLANNRFDYFPCEKYVGALLIKEMGLEDKITYIEKPIFEKSYFIAFSRHSAYPDIKKLVPAFDAALKDYYKSGAFTRAEAKYLP